MGIVRVNGLIGRSQDEVVEVAFLVDTGEFYTAPPSGLRDEFQLIPGAWGQTQVADSSIVDVELTWAFLRLNGRQGVIPVEIMNVPEPMLGVTALEALGMRVNPVSLELESVSPFHTPPTFTLFRPPPP